MASCFGIYVGSTSAYLAGRVHEAVPDIVVVLNDLGSRVTPAQVTIIENEYVVGKLHNPQWISLSNATVTCNKTSLLMKTVDTPSSHGCRRYEVPMTVRQGELCYEINLKDKTNFITPATIESCIYRYFYDIARKIYPVDKGEISCVVIVPCNATETDRAKIKSAAQDGGWNVMQIIWESTAAVLGYNLINNEEKIVIIYRIGGCGSDGSAIRVKGTMVTLQYIKETDRVGGNLLINSITELLSSEYKRKYGVNLMKSRRTFMKLTQAAEECLHKFSQSETTGYFVECLDEEAERKWSIFISRAQVEFLLRNFFSKMLHPSLTHFLKAIKKSFCDIKTALLCGRLLKIPLLNSFVTETFNHYIGDVMELPDGINYDEVLVRGAAQRALSICTDQVQTNMEEDDSEDEIASVHESFSSEAEEDIVPIPETFSIESEEDIVPIPERLSTSSPEMSFSPLSP